MRHNNIGGIMLSSLDMDDFTGMFCTGDNYPLLNTIDKQLLAPLPKNPRLRTNNLRKHVPVDLSRTTSSPTTGFIISTVVPTTIFNHEFAFETTTELPTTTPTTTPPPPPPIKSIVLNERRNEHQKPNIKPKVNSQIKPHVSKEKLKIQKKGSEKQTATIAYFDSLANIGRKQANNRIEGNRNDKRISQLVSSTQFDVTTINQIAKTTQMITTQSNNASQETDIRNFLKNAADLPSHSLINGIMKLLGNVHSDANRGNAAITKSLPPTIATSTEATRFETTTKAIIRTHIKEPDIVIPNMRKLTPSRTNKQRPFEQGKGNIRQPVQTFIDTRRDILSDQNKRLDMRILSDQNNRLDMRIPPMGNDLTARLILPNNVRNINKEAKMEPNKPKQLVPPPFPLPDMREARPSKSFLDMKDLGFLA